MSSTNNDSPGRSPESGPPTGEAAILASLQTGLRAIPGSLGIATTLSHILTLLSHTPHDAQRAQRPLLIVLNEAANACLRRVGVTPVNEVETGQDPAALRHLVEHSATVGALDEQQSGHLTSALELEALTVGLNTDRAEELGHVVGGRLLLLTEREQHVGGNVLHLV